MKQTREEWVTGLRFGSVISATLPGTPGPSLGKVEAFKNDGVIVGDFGAQGVHEFSGSGCLCADSAVLLQPVATGAGGSVGMPMQVTNVLDELQKRREDPSS